MKKKSGHFLLAMSMTLLGSLFLTITSLAAEPKGALTSVTDARITGWVWDEGQDGKTVLAGYKELGKVTHQIEDCAATGGTKVLLSGTADHAPLPANTKDTQKPAEEIGPGIPKKEKPPKPEEPQKAASPSGYKKGKSLGIFKTTAYCPCKNCSGGNGLTYSGTVPQANHTISADISVLPIGTKVMIGDTVYTVEDIGGGVKGNTIDIFFNTHQEALNYGVQKREVFSVEEK